MKTIDIHGKPYVMVKDRVIHFNKEYQNGCIKTKKLPGSDNIVIFEATVIPDVGNPERYFKGHAEEEIGSSQINKTSALENCETSAVGRALAMMGIGADESFASADEVANAVFRQNEEEATGITQAHAESITKNKPKDMSQDDPTAPYRTDLKCPVCGKAAVDRRIWEDGEFGRQTYTSGKKRPAFECIDNDDFKNPTCRGVIWDVPEEDEEDTKEADMMAQDAEGMPI